MTAPALPHPAPSPARGGYAEGFAPVAAQFAAHLRAGAEIGAGFTVYHRGQCVVDLWGGVADQANATPWERETRIVVFSVTKGLAAMALALLADRGQLAWDAPVATYWPGFGAAGKQAITVRMLVNHRAGLAAVDAPLALADCLEPARHAHLVAALEQQAPRWAPDTAQGYHAVTYGMYVRELFERIAGEPLGAFLTRELFAPLGADVSLGTPAELDPRIATLYPPAPRLRAARMFASALLPRSNEGRIVRAALIGEGLPRRAFMNPPLGAGGLATYNSIEVRRAELAWASATASAHGLARAYLPFASGGEHAGRRYLAAATLAPVHARQSWSERDLVLQKPIGWSQGFLKDETHLFCPHPESFGHAGMGGSLGWSDPTREVTIGYVMNRMDWRVRSPRALALCRALYGCAPLR